jgi:soluble lytic murein transglycosylase-like protein
MNHSKALAILTLGFALVLGGGILARHVVAATGEADTERLNRSILEYIAEKNPRAPISAFRRFPQILIAESQRSRLDHCLVLAQAEVESEFQHDAVGHAGEIGLFQILPSTAALLEPIAGRYRRPVLVKGGTRDLGDLADPAVSTRFALAYMRDIMTRKPNLRDALTEYNGGPGGRHLHYYRMVMGAYVEVLQHSELRCRYREMPRQAPVLAVMTRA